MKISPADERLLSVLREDARASTAQIARRLGITEHAALGRAKRGPFPLTWDALASKRRKAA